MFRIFVQRELKQTEMKGNETAPASARLDGDREVDWRRA